MLTGMPRYELKDGGSNKFWDITLSSLLAKGRGA